MITSIDTYLDLEDGTITWDQWQERLYARRQARIVPEVGGIREADSNDNAPPSKDEVAATIYDDILAQFQEDELENAMINIQKEPRQSNKKATRDNRIKKSKHPVNPCDIIASKVLKGVSSTNPSARLASAVQKVQETINLSSKDPAASESTAEKRTDAIHKEPRLPLAFRIRKRKTEQPQEEKKKERGEKEEKKEKEGKEEKKEKEEPKDGDIMVTFDLPLRSKQP